MNFSKPRRDQFEDAMIKALKSTKERFRRHNKRSKDPENDNMTEETAEIEEPFTKKRRNKSQENNNRNMQFANSDNIEHQANENDNLSDTELLQNDLFSDTEVQYDLSDNYEDSHESNMFEDKY